VATPTVPNGSRQPVVRGLALNLEVPQRHRTVRKQILWESETATDAEVPAMEHKVIPETGANDSAIGFMVWHVPRVEARKPPLTCTDSGARY
jgi:hypothetical protein